MWPRGLAMTRSAPGLRRLSTAGNGLRLRPLEEIAGTASAQAGLVSARAGEYSCLKVDVAADGVATVLLDRPKKQNALDMRLWQEILDVFDAVSVDATVRVAVLGSTSAHFSSGMDLSVFGEMKRVAAAESCPGRAREQTLRLVKFFQHAISSVERCEKPVIAAVDGNCLGAGVDLATACDLRYCTDGASFSVKEVDLAIVADVGTMQRLPHLVGDQRARELTYTGRHFDGGAAAKYGLALESFGGAEQLMEHCVGTARLIAAKSPLTTRGIKQVSLYTRDHGTADALEQVATWNAAMLYSDDLDEATGAFMERRRAVFKD